MSTWKDSKLCSPEVNQIKTAPHSSTRLAENPKNETDNIKAGWEGEGLGCSTHLWWKAWPWLCLLSASLPTPPVTAADLGAHVQVYQAGVEECSQVLRVGRPSNMLTCALWLKRRRWRGVSSLYLLRTHENLSSISRTHVGEPGVMPTAWNPNTGEAEPGGSLGPLASCRTFLAKSWPIPRLFRQTRLVAPEECHPRLVPDLPRHIHAQCGSKQPRSPC